MFRVIPVCRPIIQVQRIINHLPSQGLIELACDEYPLTRWARGGGHKSRDSNMNKAQTKYGYLAFIISVNVTDDTLIIRLLTSPPRLTAPSPRSTNIPESEYTGPYLAPTTIDRPRPVHLPPIIVSSV